MRRSKRPSRHQSIRERRRWPRLPLAIPVFVRGVDERKSDVLEFATILNIGGGGVLFASHKPLRERSRVSLEIPVGFPPMQEPHLAKTKLEARVLRTVAMERGYLCAVQFKSPLLARSGIRMAA
jgi:hypothetical protein